MLVMASFRFRHMSSKRCCMRPSTRSIERKSGTCASSLWSKISGSPAKLLQVETSVKYSMSAESSGDGVITGTDFEIARILGNRHVSCVLHDNCSEIVWSSDATSVKRKGIRGEAIRESVVTRDSEIHVVVRLH